MVTLTSWAPITGAYLPEVTPFPFMVIAFLFLLGGCLGSFANAAAMRLVRDESPVMPPSRCRFCDTPLRWHDNIPLIGWLILRGRSHCCKKTIPARYILAEWGFACLTAWLAWHVPLTIFVVLSLLNLIIFIALLTDSEAMVLHPPSLLAGIIIGIAASILVDNWPVTFYDSLTGTLIGGALIAGVNVIYRLTRGKNGFGQGDIWLLAMIGATFGSLSAVIIFFAASMVGAVTGITLILLQKAESGSKLPFGLFLSVVFLLYPGLNMLLV
ncbi:MAG: prepilin peptidase [Candidatus Puniceispirillaceae bacterium]